MIPPRSSRPPPTPLGPRTARPLDLFTVSRASSRRPFRGPFRRPIRRPPRAEGQRHRPDLLRYRAKSRPNSELLRGRLPDLRAVPWASGNGPPSSAEASKGAIPADVSQALAQANRAAEEFNVDS
eukprot:12635110-Alexandrium_andersonii.AAC.1